MFNIIARSHTHTHTAWISVMRLCPNLNDAIADVNQLSLCAWQLDVSQMLRSTFVQTHTIIFPLNCLGNSLSCAAMNIQTVFQYMIVIVPIVKYVNLYQFYQLLFPSHRNGPFFFYQHYCWHIPFFLVFCFCSFLFRSIPGP